MVAPTMSYDSDKHTSKIDNFFKIKNKACKIVLVELIQLQEIVMITLWVTSVQLFLTIRTHYILESSRPFSKRFFPSTTVRLGVAGHA